MKRMKAMILAAGRGSRMGALTECTPKPLLKIGECSLIEWQIKRLAHAGVREIVINLGYLGEQIAARLGSGHAYGVDIAYSQEPSDPQVGFETAGGIIHALPLLGDEPFLSVNADVWCDVDFMRFAANCLHSDAHLLFVPTPCWKAQGDYSMSGERVIFGHELTYSGIARFNPALFFNYPPGRRTLASVFDDAVEQGRLTGEYYLGEWRNIDTPQRLADLAKDYARR